MRRGVRAAWIICLLMIVGYLLSAMLLHYPYELLSELPITGIGIFFLVKLARKKFKFQQKTFD